MSDEIEHIECCEHGTQQQTFVCQHTVQSLIDNKPRGFWYSTQQLNNLRPDAWCTECEELVNKVGDWVGEAEELASIKILCGACYDKVKSLNLLG